MCHRADGPSTSNWQQQMTLNPRNMEPEGSCDSCTQYCCTLIPRDNRWPCIWWGIESGYLLQYRQAPDYLVELTELGHTLTYAFSQFKWILPECYQCVELWIAFLGGMIVGFMECEMKVFHASHYMFHVPGSPIWWCSAVSSMFHTCCSASLTESMPTVAWSLKPPNTNEFTIRWTW